MSSFEAPAYLGYSRDGPGHGIKFRAPVGMMRAAEIGAEIEREEAEKSFSDEAWFSCEESEDDELVYGGTPQATPPRCTEAVSTATPLSRMSSVV